MNNFFPLKMKYYFNNILSSFYKYIIHHNDLPTLIFPNGTKYWFINGKIHRDNEPAIIYKEGRQEWYINGKYHRDNDLPAIIEANGTQEWYINGERRWLSRMVY